MGLANTTTHASATAMQARPAYDPIKDFTPAGADWQFAVRHPGDAEAAG